MRLSSDDATCGFTKTGIANNGSWAAASPTSFPGRSRSRGRDRCDQRDADTLHRWLHARDYRLAGAAGDTVVVDINGDLSLGTNSRIQLSGLLPNQVVIAERGDVSNWGFSSLINGTLLALDSVCSTGNNDIVNGAAICGRHVRFGSSLQVRFSPATNVCVP